MVGACWYVNWSIRVVFFCPNLHCCVWSMLVLQRSTVHWNMFVANVAKLCIVVSILFQSFLVFAQDLADRAPWKQKPQNKWPFAQVILLPWHKMFNWAKMLLTQIPKLQKNLWMTKLQTYVGFLFKFKSRRIIQITVFGLVWICDNLSFCFTQALSDI